MTAPITTLIIILIICKNSQQRSLVFMVQMMIGMMIGQMKRWRDKKLPNRDVTKFQVPTTLMLLFGCCPCAKISQLSAAEQALKEHHNLFDMPSLLRCIFQSTSHNSFNYF